MTNAVQTVPQRRSLVAKMAERFGVEPEKMLSTLKATAFRVKDGEVTNEQMMALLVVAEQYGLNPWTKEIYAFPDKSSGIVPVIGVDGWSRIINSHDEFDGMEFRQSDEMRQMEPASKEAPAWMECVIYRKDRQHPVVVREYLDEVYRPVFKGKYGDVIGPWQTHTKRFLRHKTMIQGARIAFGFVGVYDEDEAARIIEGQSEIVVDSAKVDSPRSRTEAVKGKLAKNPPATPDVAGAMPDVAPGDAGWDTAYDRTETGRLAGEQDEDLGRAGA